MSRRLPLAIPHERTSACCRCALHSGWSGFGQHLPFGRLPECPRRVASGGSGRATRLLLLWVDLRRSALRRRDQNPDVHLVARSGRRRKFGFRKPNTWKRTKGQGVGTRFVQNCTLSPISLSARRFANEDMRESLPWMGIKGIFLSKPCFRTEFKGKRIEKALVVSIPKTPMIAVHHSYRPWDVAGPFTTRRRQEGLSRWLAATAPWARIRY